ncbi:ankyrin repeat and MYND domain-containing protein 1-like [Liolophura sinensis]|uniref:ankyrin repeat and MYND domain-containing protein 1-like n=1 Tax=Liolophura sinensis TaxID=3198878 RepID=UPI003158A5E6
MVNTPVQRLSSGSFECLGSDSCAGCQDETGNHCSNQAEHYWYRSGATFEGHVKDYKKTGRGIFTWPNGARYEGDYCENKRNGKGLEVWPDGSRYEGDFVDDLRHGEGHHTWPNGESYQGTFFHDRRHGSGTYTWPNNSSYTGTFHMDRREGYGSFRFASGNMFEGLYKDDSRLGPGVLTYPDGHQDVGIWRGEKLIKMCTAVTGAFSITHHPEFGCNLDEHVAYLEDQEVSLPASQNNGLGEDGEADISAKMLHFYNDTLDPRSFAVNRDLFDKEFFKGRESNAQKTQSEKHVVWNKSPSMIDLQRHILNHQFREASVSFDVGRILAGDRSKHRGKGPLEIASERLLMASMSGNHKAVLDLLDKENVHVNVCDKHGHTPLIGAVVNVHIPIVNSLLDYGADVNRLNDEGCSALSALCVYFYPVESFLFNVAETYSWKPDEKKGENSAKEICIDEHTVEEQADASKACSSTGMEAELAKLREADTPVAVKSTCDSKISMDSGLPASALRGELPSEIKQAGKDTSEISCESNIKESVTAADSNKLHPIRKDEDGDSALESEEEYTASSSALVSPEDFASGNIVRNYPIEVPKSILERCATDLSQNERVVSGRRSRDANSAAEGTARFLAIQISERELMKKTLDLLLRRGADPSVASVPMPVLFSAIKAADVEVVRTLLEKGAGTSAKLTPQKGGLSPLHIAVAIPGIEGVQITELLLEAQADPNVRAIDDNTYLNTFLAEEWSKDVIEEEQQALLGGRTPLHIACSRDDNNKNACRVVRLLLEYGAKSDLLCKGFSPLALAITSGNDLAIDELLFHGANPSLQLTHGVGSALCVASSTEYEHRRTVTQQLALIDKLVKAGANILNPIPVGPKRLQGTAVDYAFYVFNQDRVIAHMPYHALTYAERDRFNSRKKVLGHLGAILRKKAMDLERERRQREDSADGKTQSPTLSGRSGHGDGRVTFKCNKRQDKIKPVIQERKPLFKYCYECGRSVGVRLTPCTRCKEVFYCSKACKLKAWTARHKQECVCITGVSRKTTSPPRRGRSASPTPKTVPAKQTKPKDFKITVPWKGRSKSAKVERRKVYVDSLGHVITSVEALHMPDAKQIYMDNYSFV